MTADFPDDVGVAIVCYNNRDSLAATLASLDAAGCPHARVLDRRRRQHRRHRRLAAHGVS